MPASSIGGQALTEGVLVRTPARWALAVRRPDGSIHTEAHAVVERWPRLRQSALRGIVALVEAVSIGWRAIAIAARVSTGVDVGREQLGAVVAPMLVGVLLVFVVVPGALPSALPGLAGDAVEAVGRALVLVVYLALVARTSQAQRLFAYHGAEHKTIAAFERHRHLPTLDEARAESTIHVRCGTDFMALFVIGSGIVYAMVPREPLLTGALLRIGLVPVVAILAYELMRLAARYEATVPARVLTWPGRALQHITTREPDDAMLGVAAAALRAAAAPDEP